MPESEPRTMTAAIATDIAPIANEEAPLIVVRPRPTRIRPNHIAADAISRFRGFSPYDSRHPIRVPRGGRPRLRRRLRASHGGTPARSPRGHPYGGSESAG